MQTSLCMVGLSGLEPPTSRLSGVRSNHLSYKPINRYFSHLNPYGGDEEDRTPDPLRARQVLSQLSYTPKKDLSYPLNSHLLLKTKLGPQN